MQSKTEIFTSPKEVVESIEQYRKAQGISIAHFAAGWCKMDYWTWWRIVNGQADYRYHADLLADLSDMNVDAFRLICDLEEEAEALERHSNCKDAYESSNKAFKVLNDFYEEFKGAIDVVRFEEFKAFQSNPTWEEFDKNWEGLEDVE